jgi:hypothetical protein
MLDRFSLYWRIENGDLPVVHARIPLEADERCHHSVGASSYEPRRAPTEEGEGVVSLRIARGVYFRVGSMSADKLDREAGRRIADGQLYITSKRLVFDAGERSVSILLPEIAAFQVYSDGLVIERSTGKGPFLGLAEDVEMAAVILGAALARA